MTERQLEQRAAELVESWINGNINFVRQELVSDNAPSQEEAVALAAEITAQLAEIDPRSATQFAGFLVQKAAE